MRATFASLQYRNFRLWYGGQMTSLFGTWMHNTAQGYLAYELTKSPAFLGWMAFAYGAPTWFFILPAGVLAESRSKRQMMIWTQVAMMSVALIQAILTLSGWIEPWHMLVLAFLMGTANSFDAPARQSLVIELVERSHLTNAIALNGGMFNLASTIGPTIAGATYAIWGAGVCFLVNSISFLAVLIGLLQIQLPPFVKPIESPKFWRSFQDGFAYVVRERDVGALIFIVGIMGLLGASVSTLFPAWATVILSGDARVTGFLHAARGAGAVLAALVVAGLSRVISRRHVVMVSAVFFSLMMLLFERQTELQAALVVLVMAGFFQFAMINTCHGLVQGKVNDSYRARVMSIYSLVFFGAMPLGSLLIGYLAEIWGERTALGASAILFSVCMIAVFSRFKIVD